MANIVKRDYSPEELASGSTDTFETDDSSSSLSPEAVPTEFTDTLDGDMGPISVPADGQRQFHPASGVSGYTPTPAPAYQGGYSNESQYSTDQYDNQYPLAQQNVVPTHYSVPPGVGTATHNSGDLRVSLSSHQSR